VSKYHCGRVRRESLLVCGLVTAIFASPEGGRANPRNPNSLVGNGDGSGTGDSGNPGASPKPDPTPVAVIVVVGERPQVFPDRRSYALADQGLSAGAPLASALKSIPLVDVDPAGRLTLRGSPHVTVLVDGRESALFNGPERADALRQALASSYDRVEVMTNPSAAFRPDGTGGIINLITRKVRDDIKSATLNADLGTQSEALNFTASYKSGKVAVSGSASLRNTISKMESFEKREFSGSTFNSNAYMYSATNSHTISDGINLSSRLDLSPTSDVFSDFSYYENGQKLIDSYGSSAANFPVAEYYNYAARDQQRVTSKTLAGSTGYETRRGDGDGQLSLTLSYEIYRRHSSIRSSGDGSASSDTEFLVNQSRLERASSIGFKGEYARSVWGRARATIGAQTDYEGQQRTDALQGIATLSEPFSNLTQFGSFRTSTVTSAGYATVNFDLNKLAIMPGTRVEQTEIGIFSGDLSRKTNINYYSAFPTIHISYSLGALAKLTVSETRRIDRPPLQYFNPVITFISPSLISSGNASLRPSYITSYEASYDFRKGKEQFLITGYYRVGTGTYSLAQVPQARGVTLQTYINGGRSISYGLDCIKGGALLPTTGYLFSGSLKHYEFDQFLGANSWSRKSGPEFSARFSLTWKPTSTDAWQTTVRYIGRRPVLQGYQLERSSLDASYRHSFANQAILDLSVSDVFQGDSFRSRLVTSIYKSSTNTNFHGRQIRLGLSIPLGSTARR
jgi:outer membrane receptor for ferrienterochelin and colicin